MIWCKVAHGHMLKFACAKQAKMTKFVDREVLEVFTLPLSLPICRDVTRQKMPEVDRDLLQSGPWRHVEVCLREASKNVEIR